MRLATSTWSFVLALAFIACDDGNTTTQPGGCAAGQVLCNGQCVAAGNCQTNTGGASNTTAPATGGATSSTSSNPPPATGGAVAATGGAATGSTATGGTKPATGGTSAATGGTSAATGGATASNPDVCDDVATIKTTMTDQYQKAFINTTNNSAKSYVAITNWWSKFTNQTVALDGLSFTITNSADAGSAGAPVGFPSIHIGKYQTNASNRSNLPIQVSAIKSVPTVFETNATTLDTSNFNATYDVWLTSSSAVLSDTASSPGSTGVMLMVWLFKPSNRQPRGAISGPNHTVSGVDGSWNVWVDTNAGGTSPTVSYVSTSPRSAMTFDLNKFLQDAVTNNYLVKSSMYLSVVFGGFEVWSGGNGAQLKKFCVKVN